jgi:hypothetical protein
VLVLVLSRTYEGRKSDMDLVLGLRVLSCGVESGGRVAVGVVASAELPR